MRLVLLVVLLGGCATPSEVAVGETLLAWALPLFLLSVVAERAHALLTYRRALRLLPGQCWGWVLACLLGLAATSAVIVSSTDMLVTVLEPSLVVVIGLGYSFYLGFGLLMVGRDRRGRSRLRALLLPMCVIVAPGAVLAVFGSTNPADNALLWLTMPIITVAPALVGPAMLLLAFTVALVSPYCPGEPVPAARLRSGGGGLRHSR